MYFRVFIKILTAKFGFAKMLEVKPILDREFNRTKKISKPFVQHFASLESRIGPEDGLLIFCIGDQSARCGNQNDETA